MRFHEVTGLELTIAIVDVAGHAENRFGLQSSSVALEGIVHGGSGVLQRR